MKSLAKHIWRHWYYLWSHHRILLLVNMVAAYIIAFFDILAILLTGRFIDAMVSLLVLYQEINWTELVGTSAFQYLVYLGLIWLAQRALKAVVKSTDKIIFHSMSMSYRDSVMQKMGHFNLGDILDPVVYNLLQNVDDFWLEQMKNFYHSFRDVGKGLIKLALALGVFWKISPVWGIALMLIVIPEQIVRFVMDKKLKRSYDGVVHNRRYQDYIYNIVTLVRFYSENRVNGILHSLRRQFNKHGKVILEKLDRIYLLREVTIGLAAQFDKIMQWFFKVLLIIYAVGNRLSIGTFKYLFDYIDTLYESSGVVLNQLINMNNALFYLNDFHKFVDLQVFGDEPTPANKKFRQRVKAVRVKDLSFTYPYSENVVLKKVNLSARQGERVAIVGGDGAGKSSLINLMAGLFKISEGSITFNKVDIRNIARQQIKDRIAITFEDFGRYYFTIKENIIISDLQKPFDEKLYQKALQITGLDKWMKEQGYTNDQILGNYFSNGVEISSGHWQRIAIARMIYRDRDVFIMDEPFNYIDEKSRIRILDQLLDFVGDRILIAMVRDRTLLNYFTKVYYLEKGEIVKKIAAKQKEDLGKGQFNATS